MLSSGTYYIHSKRGNSKNFKIIGDSGKEISLNHTTNQSTSGNYIRTSVFHSVPYLELAFTNVTSNASTTFELTTNGTGPTPVTINTYASPDVPSEFVETGSGVSVDSITGATGPLSPGTYNLTLRSKHGAEVAADNATVTVEPRSTNGLTAYTTRDVSPSDFDNATAIRGAIADGTLTSEPTATANDTVVYAVNATGLTGLPATANASLDRGADLERLDGISFGVAPTESGDGNESAAGDGLGRTPNESAVHLDRKGLYVVAGGDHAFGTENPGPGETFEAAFRVDDDRLRRTAADDRHRVTTELAHAAADSTDDGAENQTTNGSTETPTADDAVTDANESADSAATDSSETPTDSVSSGGGSAGGNISASSGESGGGNVSTSSGESGGGNISTSSGESGGGNVSASSSGSGSGNVSASSSGSAGGNVSTSSGGSTGGNESTSSGELTSSGGSTSGDSSAATDSSAGSGGSSGGGRPAGGGSSVSGSGSAGGGSSVSGSGSAGGGSPASSGGSAGGGSPASNGGSAGGGSPAGGSGSPGGDAAGGTAGSAGSVGRANDSGAGGPRSAGGASESAANRSGPPTGGDVSIAPGASEIPRSAGPPELFDTGRPARGAAGSAVVGPRSVDGGPTRDAGGESGDATPSGQDDSSAPSDPPASSDAPAEGDRSPGEADASDLGYDDAPIRSTAYDLPGFGPLASLASVVGASLLARRRGRGA